ncbi:MAG: DUF3048 domain-containing protein [Actinomycetota bacterium]
MVCGVIVVLLVASGCDGGDDPTVAVTPSPSPSPTPDPTCPLTGMDPPPEVDPERVAVAVKIEDSPLARPQSGLEDADLVFEEIVEGGITRFMAIYHCNDVKQVGPVRSARFDDPKLAYPFTRVLAFSGGNDIVEKELAARKLFTIDEDDADGGLYRIPPGVLEVHNLFGDTRKLRALAPARLEPPKPDVFKFGELAEGHPKARRVTVNFTAGNTIEYRWEGKSWRRYEAGEPFFTEAGDQIAVPNVLIQEVEVNHSPTIVDSAGNPSPDIRLTGSGRALLFRDGRVVKGKWTIRKELAPPKYTTKDGEPVVFAPGPIWIELVPSKKGVVKGSFSFK